MSAPENKSSRWIVAAAVSAIAIGAWVVTRPAPPKPAPPSSAPTVASAAPEPRPPAAPVAAPLPSPKPKPSPARNLPAIEPTALRQITSAVDRTPGCVANIAVQSDALWALDQAQGILEQPELAADLDKRKRAIDATSPLGVLLDPNAPPYALPADAEKRATGPEGQLMLTVLDSVACRGGKAPSARLEKFVNDSHDGYLLTHQFFAIEWAERAGCALPDEWLIRKERLVDRVLAELRRSRGFSDLFVEQVFVLELAGRSEQVDPSWIARIVKAQGSDGCWSDSNATDIPFAGGTIHSTQEADHTTGLALYTLARYRYDRR